MTPLRRLALSPVQSLRRNFITQRSILGPGHRPPALINVQSLTGVNLAARRQAVDAQKPVEVHVVLLGDRERAVPATHFVHLEVLLGCEGRRFGVTRKLQDLADIELGAPQSVYFLNLAHGGAVPFGDDPQRIAA